MAKLLENMGYPSAQVAAANIAKLQPIFDRANTTLNSLAAELKTSTEINQQNLQRTVTRVVWLIGIVTLLILLTIVPLTLLNMNSICRPIVQAEQMSKAIARGDLTAQDVDMQGNDETAHLLRSLVDMQTGLASLVGQVRQATDSLSTASAEIACEPSRQPATCKTQRQAWHASPAPSNSLPTPHSRPISSPRSQAR